MEWQKINAKDLNDKSIEEMEDARIDLENVFCCPVSKLNHTE